MSDQNDNLPQRPEDPAYEPSTNASLRQPSPHDAYVKSVAPGVIELKRGPLKRVWVNKNHLPQFGGTPSSPIWNVEIVASAAGVPIRGPRYVGIFGVVRGTADLCPLDLDLPDGPHAYVQTTDEVTLYTEV